MTNSKHVTGAELIDLTQSLLKAARKELDSSSLTELYDNLPSTLDAGVVMSNRKHPSKRSVGDISSINISSGQNNVWAGNNFDGSGLIVAFWTAESGNFRIISVSSASGEVTAAENRVLNGNKEVWMPAARTYLQTDSLYLEILDQMYYYVNSIFGLNTPTSKSTKTAPAAPTTTTSAPRSTDTTNPAVVDRMAPSRKSKTLAIPIIKLLDKSERFKTHELSSSPGFKFETVKNNPISSVERHAKHGIGQGIDTSLTVWAQSSVKRRRKKDQHMEWTFQALSLQARRNEESTLGLNAYLEMSLYANTETNIEVYLKPNNADIAIYTKEDIAKLTEADTGYQQIKELIIAASEAINQAIYDNPSRRSDDNLSN